jgi:NitT/TauT family transport system permease protein
VDVDDTGHTVDGARKTRIDSWNNALVPVLIAMAEPESGGASRTRLVRGMIGIAVVGLVLEAVTRAELVNPIYLPPASTVLLTSGRILLDAEFLSAVVATLQAWAIGLLIAIAVAVPLGLLLGSSRRAWLAGTAAIEFLRPIPSVALIPLAIILWGTGPDMTIRLIVYASTWPILFNTIYGMREVDPIAKDTARAFGYSRLEVLWRVSMRSASPFVYTGFRVAAAIALIVAVSTELIAGGSDGIGTWMLVRSQSGTEREFVYAGTVVAGLLGLVINAFMVLGERRLFFWHQRMRIVR